MLTLEQADFPDFLRQALPLPERLYYEGNLPGLLTKHRLAVVGSRKVSAYGRQVTSDLTGQVAGQGIVIISGLAFGIDSIAHKAALEANRLTIAVMGCGLDAIYPPQHAGLAQQILDHGGALVSEYPAGTPPLQFRFIARNRIIAALSEAVLIPEAAQKSGSLHTARFALEQGREVLSVPGNITSPNSSGTNNLIRAGATPVLSAEDIFHALNIEPSTAGRETLAKSATEAVLLKLLKAGVSEASELLRQSQLAAAEFNQTLTMLEITGKIRPLGAGHWGLNLLMDGQSLAKVVTLPYANVLKCTVKET